MLHNQVYLVCLVYLVYLVIWSVRVGLMTGFGYGDGSNLGVLPGEVLFGIRGDIFSIRHEKNEGDRK